MRMRVSHLFAVTRHDPTTRNTRRNGHFRNRLPQLIVLATLTTPTQLNVLALCRCQRNTMRWSELAASTIDIAKTLSYMVLTRCRKTDGTCLASCSFAFRLTREAATVQTDSMSSAVARRHEINPLVSSIGTCQKLSHSKLVRASPFV